MKTKYKYYIRLAANNDIIYAFTDEKEEPIVGDIQVGETPERCWGMQIKDMKGMYKYKWYNNAITKKTEMEKQAIPEYLAWHKENRSGSLKSIINSNWLDSTLNFSQIQGKWANFKASVASAVNVVRVDTAYNTALTDMGLMKLDMGLVKIG